jgi:hypothetical protein
MDRDKKTQEWGIALGVGFLIVLGLLCLAGKSPGDAVGPYGPTCSHLADQGGSRSPENWQAIYDACMSTGGE